MIKSPIQVYDLATHRGRHKHTVLPFLCMMLKTSGGNLEEMLRESSIPHDWRLPTILYSGIILVLHYIMCIRLHIIQSIYWLPCSLLWRAEQESIILIWKQIYILYSIQRR